MRAYSCGNSFAAKLPKGSLVVGMLFSPIPANGSPHQCPGLGTRLVAILNSSRRLIGDGGQPTKGPAFAFAPTIELDLDLNPQVQTPRYLAQSSCILTAAGARHCTASRFFASPLLLCLNIHVFFLPYSTPPSHSAAQPLVICVRHPLPLV